MSDFSKGFSGFGLKFGGPLSAYGFGRALRNTTTDNGVVRRVLSEIRRSMAERGTWHLPGAAGGTGRRGAGGAGRKPKPSRPKHPQL